MRRPGTAAVLSFLLPGLGQLYNGDLARAMFWFVFAVVFYASAFVLAGPLTLAAILGHAIPSWTAYRRAEIKGLG